MNKVLIFGVGGFVGQYLSQEFASHGYKVYGSDMVPADKLNPITSEILEEYMVGDLMDEENIKEIVSDVKPSHIVNLAAISSVGLSWKIPQKTVAVNVCGAINILEAAREQEEIPRVLLIGSSEEYVVSDAPISEKTEINANNPYGLSKMMQEKFSEVYRERYGMKVYHARPFNHTGAGQNVNFVIPSWCKQAAEITKSGKPGVIQVGNLEVKRDFSNVKDVVRAYRMIIESDDCSVAYNVGSGTAIYLREMLEHILSLSDQEITVEINPDFYRPADNELIQCDHSLITEKLGWKPEYTIYDTVKEVYEHFLKEC